MGKFKEILKSFEAKISIYFAISVFFLVFFIGVIKGVYFFVIIKRVVFAEIFFIPLGYAIGYILKLYSIFGIPKTAKNIEEKEESLIEEKPNPNQSNQNSGSTQEVEGNEEPSVQSSPPGSSIFGKKAGIVGIEGPAEDISEIEKSLNKKEDGSPADKFPDLSINTAPIKNPLQVNVVKSQQQFKKLKELANPSSDHIIVNDRKIVNDPKEMAKAVRTIMSRE